MTTRIFNVHPLPPTTPTNDQDGGDVDRPSWGLIIPIIMICVFLISVGICLWWRKWRDKNVLHIHRNNVSFQRSYRGSRSARNNLDAIRDSTRSTLPLRNSMNKKNNNINNNIAKNTSMMTKVNVIPVDKPGKYSFHWDTNHWKAYPQQRNRLARSGTKPLSPIDEIDSPTSIKLSELSRNYDVSNQPSCSPYHLTWMTSSNGPPSSYTESAHTIYNDVRSRPPNHFRFPGDDYMLGLYTSMKDPNQNSPFFPNNNTPTTECESPSETSRTWDYNPEVNQPASQFTSYPSSLNSHTVLSVSNSHMTHSNEEQNMMSYGSSFPESSYQTQSEDQCSSQTSLTEPHSTNLSSLPSSIAQFSRQNVLHNDPNNNNNLVPNAYLPYQLTKLNHTLASSMASSDTQISDNTSLLPNIGSNNTSVYPSNANFRSMPTSNEQSGHVSPEDLSKLVDEMSSIRHVDESSSVRPNSTFDPTPHIVSVGGSSMTAGTQESFGPPDGQLSINSMATGSQSTSKTESLIWDNYPLQLQRELQRERSRSFPDLSHLMHDNLGFEPYIATGHVPVLMKTEYWV